jgi:hypothetical protein
VNDRSTDLKIIVQGCMVFLPLPGVLFQVLHYMAGLRHLGFDPWYVEDSDRWVYDPDKGEITEGTADSFTRLVPFLKRYGMLDRFCYRAGEHGQTFGADHETIERLYSDADILLNITGAQDLRDAHMDIPVRVYVESDPFASQVKAVNGDAFTRDQLDRHTHHFTFGENIGRSNCDIPDTGHTWQPTRQPVVLSIWFNDRPGGSAYRTITTWKNKGKDIEWNGDTYYWTKDREFLRYLELPTRVEPATVLATDVDNDTERLLRQHGWQIDDSAWISADTDRYVNYIQESRGEFTIARDQYYRPNTGWFSDRSACYLASGRPVITQETGFSDHIPTGEGLFAFSTLDEAVAAVEAVESSYERHCKAAREIAEEYFDSRKVLARLLDEVMSS